MKARLLILGLCLGIFCAIPSRADETIRSPYLTVTVSSKKGTWNCSAENGQVLLENAKAEVATATGRTLTTDLNVNRRVAVSTFQDSIGDGKQVTLSITNPQSRLKWLLAIKVYNGLPGLRLDWELTNSTGKELNLRRVKVITSQLRSSSFRSVSTAHVLINGFGSWDYSHVAKVIPSSAVEGHDQIAVDHPKLVAGYLSAKHTYGTFTYRISPSAQPDLSSTAEFNVILDPGQTRHTDPLLILFPKDLFEGLEKYASSVQTFNHVHQKPYANTAWCSFYAGYRRADQAHPDALQKAVLVNARLMAPLVPLGADTLRVVDNSDEERYGDWNFRFIPEGMGKLSASLHALGRRPGVWLAPAFVSENSNLFKQHPDWLQRNSAGELITRKHLYKYTLHFLDASNPAVLQYLHNLFTRVRNWGYQYVMIDFLDSFGLSDHYYNPHMTRAEIYREALATIRNALGPNIYLLGCGAPQLASVGLVNGMRIGTDAWGEEGFENVAARYFEAGKWWLNDPDALVGNNRPVEEYRAWNTLAAMSGSVITIGDDLSMLAREKWGILERILPAEGRVGTPVDLFQSAPNNIWFLPTNLPGSKSGVLSLFNWGSKVAITHKINLATVLNTKGKVLAYDFWNDCLLAEKNDDLEVSVPPRNVRTFCLVEAENRPQVLDVSNFLPQTGWGLDKVKWSAATKVLQGETEGLSGKMYHIVFYSPKTYAPIEATVNGRRILLVKQRESVWVIPITGSNHPEEWSVKFQSK